MNYCIRKWHRTNVKSIFFVKFTQWILRDASLSSVSELVSSHFNYSLEGKHLIVGSQVKTAILKISWFINNITNCFTFGHRGRFQLAFFTSTSLDRLPVTSLRYTRRSSQGFRFHFATLSFHLSRYFEIYRLKI